MALGHGGTSADYTCLEYLTEGHRENTFEVRGRGKRLKNELVEFRIGNNMGVYGQFKYGDKTTVTAGGPPQKIEPSYSDSKYGARFDGHVRSDGPTGYVISGRLIGTAKNGSNFCREATFGYKTVGGSWKYKTTEIPVNPTFTIRGTRAEGEDIAVITGVTAGTFGVRRLRLQPRGQGVTPPGVLARPLRTDGRPAPIPEDARAGLRRRHIRQPWQYEHRDVTAARRPACSVTPVIASASE
ncbi:hypothetical protein [Streptomyces sp. NPDC058612]|uniref:hypothetical protein n=1 Tax=Streptomyces sp. NPDC058612 TaxID=3346555 RepID=UPI00364A7CB6